MIVASFTILNVMIVHILVYIGESIDFNRRVTQHNNSFRNYDKLEIYCIKFFFMKISKDYYSKSIAKFSVLGCTRQNFLVRKPIIFDTRSKPPNIIIISQF